jgi:CxxC motif-containing protein (DUF1111 family)
MQHGAADFAQMEKLGNLTFRIPTPLFGAGLIENIPEATLYANQAANVGLKESLGISGHPNISGNDGTITRFGWKAQNKSVEIFAGEAYNVEMGVTNELFPEERSLPPASCLFNPTPEDTTNFPASGAAVLSDVVAFSNLMRFLAPPTPSTQGIPGNLRRNRSRTASPCLARSTVPCVLKAIQDHAGSGSEANGVINLFQQLNSQQQQDLLNFLRSL